MKNWTLIGLFLVAGGAARAQTAAEVLAKADATYGNFADLSVEAVMKIYEPGSATPREFGFVTTIKGDRRLVRFTSPGDVKGMGMLLENRETMYVYLPGFQRIRRMGTHAKGQTFMGSDFGYEDMAESTYTGYWIPKIVGSDGNEVALELTVAPGKEAEFPKLKVWFDKVHYLATKIDFFDDKGSLARSETRADFKRDEGPIEHWTPGTITLIDHRRNDHKTVMQFVKVKVNQGLTDALFNQRSLMRGGQ